MKEINGALFKSALVSAANHISNNKNEINDLNVFPVPDGDTGTNMSMTIMAARRAVEEIDSERLPDVFTALSSAILRGARGNSGVILSQLFRGMVKHLEDRESVDAVAFAEALDAGVAAAYKAVMRPTEGTILTVARETAEYALELAPKNDDFISFFELIIGRSKESLAQTPELLPELKQAGVVDSGGMGLVCIYEGMYDALRGKPVALTDPGTAPAPVEKKAVAFATSDITFAYCTEFIITKKNKNQSTLQFSEAIANMGDSNLVIDDDDIVKVHVHTNHPGRALEQALKIGELSSIKIDNMKIQHNEIVIKSEPAEPEPPKEYGMIAVASGDGMIQLFKELGVDVVVSGGQSMNPSTEDLLAALAKVNAETVFILPNNKNIILAAEQAATEAAEQGEKRLIVIPTKTIPQGISAVLAMEEGEDADGKAEAMKDALSLVRTGQVTFAARDSVYNGREINAKDVLGVVEGDIKYVGQKADRVALEVVDHIASEGNHDVITVFFGEDIKEKDAQKLYDKLEKKYPGSDVLLQSGGQPLYYYIISIE